MPPVPNRQANGGHQVQILGGLQNGLQALLRAIEQGILQEKVPAGIPGEAQLRQRQDLDALLVGLPHHGEDLLSVITAVRHMDLGRAGRDFDESVSHSEDLLMLVLQEYSTPGHRD